MIIRDKEENTSEVPSFSSGIHHVYSTSCSLQFGKEFHIDSTSVNNTRGLFNNYVTLNLGF